MITAPFRGLALGVFLITVGMSIDLAAIGAQWSALLLGACVGVVAAKAIVTALLLRAVGRAHRRRRRDRAADGVARPRRR